MEELRIEGQLLCMDSCSQVNSCGNHLPCRREITFGVYEVIEGCKVCKRPCTRPLYRALLLLRPLSIQAPMGSLENYTTVMVEVFTFE